MSTHLRATHGRACLNCVEWEDNIDKVNGPILSWSLRYGLKGYNGNKFKFCPWCGTHLTEVGNEPTRDL